MRSTTSMDRTATPVNEGGMTKGSLTRRAVFAGAVSALVGGQVISQAQGLTFDIRTFIDNAALDNDCIQCIYDTVNRMVGLIGDLPFTQLFGTPMSSLAPVVRARIGVLAEDGLIKNPNTVDSLMGSLQSIAATLTVGDFYARSRTTVPTEVMNTLIGLRREGVQIPLPVGDAKTAKVRSKALSVLLRDAGTLTFQGLFTMAHQDASSKAVRAVVAARTQTLFAWFNNDRACDHGAGPIPGTDLCVSNVGTWCNITRNTGLCSIGSDPIPNEKDPNGPG